MRLDTAVADTSALLSLVGVLPLEPLDVSSIVAADVSLVEIVAVLRSFHDGRTSDILGDLAAIGPMVTEWVATHRVAGTLAELAVAHPDQLTADLAAVAVARVLRLPLVTGQPDLAGLDPDVAVIVLPRSRQT
jgi:hypothetical protein